MIISSNPVLRAEAEEMLPALARLSGLELMGPIRIEERSREELELYLRAQFDKEFTPRRADDVVQAYALLGMMPEGLDLRQLMLTILQEQVAGFYDPDSTTLYVMNDQPEVLRQTILVHELVHAVQDQHADLDAITAEELGNDRQMAAKAALEGHATLVMTAYLTEQITGTPLDVTRLPSFTPAGTLDPALLEAQSPTLAGAPLVLRESLIFPYLGGMAFTQELWRFSGQVVAPLGDHLPRSSEHILFPETFLGPEPDEPTEIRFTGDTEPRYDNSLGAQELAVFLESLIGPEMRSLVRGWDGDRFALFGTGPDASLIWASVWDDEGSRDRFLMAVEPALGALPRDANISSATWNGRPGVVIRVGDVPEMAVRLLPQGAS